MTRCPWYISAAAVRAWQAVDARAPRDFDAASDLLIEIAADIWHERYAPPSEKQPKRTRSTALVYEAGRKHCEIRLVVAPGEFVDGKMAVVDVLARHGAVR